MFGVKVDRIHAIVEYALQGRVEVADMELFLAELRQALLSIQGRDIRIKADLRGFRPMAPELAEMIRDSQAFALSVGVSRVAEIVESDIVALQLNRVARESGTEKILRRFGDEPSALEWLLGDVPGSSGRSRLDEGGRGLSDEGGSVRHGSQRPQTPVEDGGSARGSQRPQPPAEDGGPARQGSQRPQPPPPRRE